MKTKPIYKGYDREVLMAEWKPINKEHHRRLRNCMVVSIGINIFLLLVMVLR
jgi:predicted nucleic acid-binding Zn ribbon protein